MEKRGQAALEFLMTYGWAILAVVIVVALLAAFGVFRPKAPNVCGHAGVIETGLTCPDLKVDSSGNVTLKIGNGFGEDITINAISVTLDVAGSSYHCNNTFGVILEAGSEKIFVVPNCGNLTAGSRFKGTVTVSYTRGGIEHNPQAPLTGTVEASGGGGGESGQTGGSSEISGQCVAITPGETSYCDELDSEDVCKACGCYWEDGICHGEEINCSQITDEGNCSICTKCEWQTSQQQPGSTD